MCIFLRCTLFTFILIYNHLYWKLFIEMAFASYLFPHLRWWIKCLMSKYFYLNFIIKKIFPYRKYIELNWFLILVFLLFYKSSIGVESALNSSKQICNLLLDMQLFYKSTKIYLSTDFRKSKIYCIWICK